MKNRLAKRSRTQKLFVAHGRVAKILVPFLVHLLNFTNPKIKITKIRGQAQNGKTRGNLRSSCLLGIGLLLLSRRQRPKQRTSVVRAAAFDRVASRTTRAPARPRGPDCPHLLSVAGPISLPILPFFSIRTIKRLSRILTTRHRSHFHVTV